MIIKNAKEPILTLMLRSNTPEDLINEIKSGIEMGAQAFGFQLELMARKYRTEEYLKPIFDAMDGRIAYITNYRRDNVGEEPLSDDELTEEMLTAVKCGAKIFDVRGDLFDISKDEITYNPEAVEKQKKLIDKIHEMGALALMSSHVFRYLTPDEALKIAKAQSERNVDIVKIVANSDTKEQLYSNLQITAMLANEIPQPVLFLSNGEFCRIHRIYGPFISKPNLFLVGNNSEKGIAQPNICDAIEAQKLAERKVGK